MHLIHIPFCLIPDLKFYIWYLAFGLRIMCIFYLMNAFRFLPTRRPRSIVKRLQVLIIPSIKYLAIPVESPSVSRPTSPGYSKSANLPLPPGLHVRRSQTWCLTFDLDWYLYFIHGSHQLTPIRLGFLLNPSSYRIEQLIRIRGFIWWFKAFDWTMVGAG